MALYFVRGVTGSGKGLPRGVAMIRRLAELYRHWGVWTLGLWGGLKEPPLQACGIQAA